MTIEELREGVIVGLRTLGLEKGLDTLIAAAHAEGFAEGVEDTTADLALVQDTETFAKGRAEGAEQLKAEIRKGAHFTFDQAGRGTWHVDVSVLAPKEEK